MHSISSCARSLHFTDDGALIIGESDDVISICHTRDFSLRQDIRFFGSIAGVALLDGGSEVVVANADKTVGGILSFDRTPQGLNTDGEQLFQGISGSQSSFHHKMRSHHSTVRHSELVSDVLV